MEFRHVLCIPPAERVRTASVIRKDALSELAAGALEVAALIACEIAAAPVQERLQIARNCFVERGETAMGLLAGRSIGSEEGSSVGGVAGWYAGSLLGLALELAEKGEAEDQAEARKWLRGAVPQAERLLSEVKGWEES